MAQYYAEYLCDGVVYPARSTSSYPPSEVKEPVQHILLDMVALAIGESKKANGKASFRHIVQNACYTKDNSKIKVDGTWVAINIKELNTY